MDDWRDRILREFTPNTARLTLVADPDGLLLEETLLEAIRERGFEILPFEDSVTFRFAYESRFRSRWDQGDRGESADLVVLVRAERHQLAATLPWDLLRAGRQLSFGLSELFPGLSYPVVASLDHGHLATLHRARMRFGADRLGDDATKDFALLHVFRIAPALIRQPADLLRTLLRRHHRGERLPPILDDRLIHLLRGSGAFDSWPLEAIVPARDAFFSFLQDRWPRFLDRLAGNAAVGAGSRDASGSAGLALEGPADLPFDHDDIRVYIDNLFLEGMLSAVSHEAGEALRGTWAAVGIRIDPEADRARRLAGLMEAAGETIPGPDARHHEWTAFAYRWAELEVLRLEAGAATRSSEMGTLTRSETGARIAALRKEVDRSFLAWVERRYAGLHNQPPDPPVMVHHVPRYLARRIEDGSAGKAALIVVDGLALAQWIVLRDVLADQRPCFHSSRRRGVRLGADHHVRVAAGDFRREAAVLLPLEHPHHGPRAVTVAPVLGGPRHAGAGRRLRKRAGRRPGRRRQRDPVAREPPRARPRRRQGRPDHARHGAGHRGHAQPGSTMGRRRVHGDASGPVARRRVRGLPDLRPRQHRGGGTRAAIRGRPRRHTW